MRRIHLMVRLFGEKAEVTWATNCIGTLLFQEERINKTNT